MKKIFLFILFPLLLASCSNNDSNDIDPSLIPVPAAESISIAEGSVVSTELDSLVVTYDADVVLNPLAPVTISQGEITSTKIVDKRQLIVGFSLSYGKHYVVSIPAKAVLGYESKKYADAIDIAFSTEGAPDVAANVVTSLTNSNASDNAKAVYQTLLQYYGQRQFSGAMGEVAWNTGFCDLIYATSGQYPAIVGFDYIHLASSPANWIDYGDITPVKKIWDAGSIPTMTWHWNVPVSEGSSTLVYNATSDQFKASNVLIEGTWENKVATADVEKLAGYMKLLQEADIPVLWRPFHEAAGDYTWGHWFWWGNSGVEVTKQLWVWLRDKLTNEYGLNNLIWVWTVQTSDAGQLASVTKLAEAYPGDDVVDIVGTDLYPDETLTNQTPQFELVYNLVKGKKIVALTECGNLLDVDSAYSDGALWCYFMGWYEMDANGNLGFSNWNSNGEWRTVLNNPLVLNRGDFTIN